MPWDLVVGIVVGVVTVWFLLVAALIYQAPNGVSIAAAMRLLPDTVRLVHRLARDKSLNRSVRVSLSTLLFYLALPIDLIPDFVPIIGYADDAIVMYLVMRRVVKRVDDNVLRHHWRGSADGFNALKTLFGLEI